MRNMFEWISIGFGVLAAVAGVLVLRGVFQKALSSASTVRFFRWSLVASFAGLIPLSHHLTLVQQICMLSVYCSAAAIVAWLRFGLLGHSRQIFVVAVTAVLYFDIACLATRLFRNPPLLPTVITQPPSLFQLIQVFFAVTFIVLGILAVRKCGIEPSHGKLTLRGI